MWFERLLSLGVVLVSFGSQRTTGVSDVCLQDPFFKGECDKNQLRWSFNQQWETCTPFIFGGCGGNENNFGSKEDCVAACIENAASPSGSGRSVAFELEPESHMINETQIHDSDQETMTNLPNRCLDEMVHHAPIRKTKKCKLEFIDEVSESSGTKRGWTFDARRNRCRSRPYLESACADTKNKFITSSECKRVCESNSKQDLESESEYKFWKNFKKQSYKTNFKLRNETKDWLASCADHPVWVVNKLRKSWIDTLSQYDSIQAGYSYNPRTRQCVKVKDIVKSPTLNKFFTKSECTRCKVLPVVVKRTCFQHPKISPVGFCTSKESVIESVDEGHDPIIDIFDEDQNMRRRRRRRRRNQLRNKIDRDDLNPVAKKVWSFFDGDCMVYPSDSCIKTRNAFKSKAECKQKCPSSLLGTKSQDLPRIPSRDRLFKNLYFYHPDHPSMKGVFFFYLPMHFKLISQIDVNRLFKISKRKSRAKGRSEVSDDETDKKDQPTKESVEGRSSWSMYDLRDVEVVNKEKAEIKKQLQAEAKAKALAGKRGSVKTTTTTTTIQPTNDEDSVASEDTTLPPKPITTTRTTVKFKVMTLKVTGFKPTTPSFNMETTTERTSEKSSHQPHPRCLEPPPAFGRCKKALTTVWSFLDSECEELRHNLCSVKVEISNVFMSKTECLSVCKNMGTSGEKVQPKPNSPAIVNLSPSEQEKQKCRAPPTSIEKCKPPKKQTKPEVVVDVSEGRISSDTNDFDTNFESDLNQQGRLAQDGEVSYYKDDFQMVADSQERSRYQRLQESGEGRLGVSGEDFGQSRSTDDDDGDISLGRSASDVDDDEQVAGRSSDLGKSEIIGQSWIIDKLPFDGFPEWRSADEDGDEPHVLVKRRTNKSGDDDETPPGESGEKEDESKPKGRKSVRFHSGYIFIDGFCKEYVLKLGDCFKKTDNFFDNLTECTKACTRPGRIRKPATEVM